MSHLPTVAGWLNLPVIPRLERLDLLLNYIEGSCNNLLVPVSQIDDESDDRRNISAALEEVHLKGSIIERVTSLEHHLLKIELFLISCHQLWGIFHLVFQRVCKILRESV